MKRTRILVTILALLVVLSGCGKTSDGSDNSANSEPSAAEEVEEAAEEIEQVEIPTGLIPVCLGDEPVSLDPALNSTASGASILSHLFSGLAKWQKDDSGKLSIVPDCAKELVNGVVNEDGTVVFTYKLKDGLKWSDGKDLKADDFVYAWKRAGNVATGGAYYYMFEAIDGYDEEDPSAELNIRAIDDKTLEVTLAKEVSYWNELLAFPTFFPVREDVASDENWAKEADSYVSNGPYKMIGWNHGDVIVVEKNPDFYDAANMKAEKIEFHLSEDANDMVDNFKSGAWTLIDDVPTNEINILQSEYPEEFKVAGEMSTYFVCWNINQDLLPANSGLEGADAEKAREEIRKAINLLYDRYYIVDAIGQAGQVPAASLVAMGMTDVDGNEFYKNANKESGNSYIGYYNTSVGALESNRNDAVETLKKYYDFDETTGMFKDFPNIRYLYNTSNGHKAIGEYMQSVLAEYGISMIVEEQEWSSFLQARRNGEFTIARNGWFADYNDPICFLDMWTTSSGNNFVQYGNGANNETKAYSMDLTDLGYENVVENGTWAETYDVIISKINNEKDTEKRYALMHKAEDMLMSTGCICPIFYYTDTYMINQSMDGFYSNPLGYKYFMYSTIN